MKNTFTHAKVTPLQDTQRLIRITFCTIAVLCFHCMISAQTGRLINFPQEVTVHEGQEFVISIYADPGGAQVSVIDLYLQFNPAVLNLLEVEKLPCPLNLNQIEPLIDNESGSLLYGAFRLQKPWPEERFELFRLHFLALATSENTQIAHEEQAGLQSLMAYAGENVMHEAINTDVTVLPNGHSHPPVSALNSTEFSISADTVDTITSVTFKPSEDGETSLELKAQESAFNHTIYNYQAFANNQYRFRIDTSILASGEYEFILNSSGNRYVQKLLLPDK